MATYFINSKIFNVDSLNSNPPSGTVMYINPLFGQRNNVFINPNFVAPVQPTYVPPITKTYVESKPKEAPASNNKYSWKRPSAQPSERLYVNATKTKLIRQNHPQPNFNLSYPSRSKLKVEKRSLNSHAHIQHNWKKVLRREPYSLQNMFPKMIINKGNKYKICRKIPEKSIITPAKANKRPSKETTSSNKKLVNIGGIFYNVTSKKMTRTAKCPSLSTKEPEMGRKEFRPTTSTRKASNKHIINICGETYLLCRNGQTLRRLNTKTAPLRTKQRIDFGGVTFRATNPNEFVRTNSHRARVLLLSARQRSIACLTASRRKQNIPCAIFNRLGRCCRFERGLCNFIHDKRNVALCKRNMRGKCKDKECLLSHDIIHQKVATCHYFLEGVCGRENCPYLHVKVSGRAKICRRFLRGYCELGQQCTERHENICPEFESTGKCINEKKCPYPHKTIKKSKLKNSGQTKWKRKSLEKQSSKKESILKYGEKCKEIAEPSTSRYYDSVQNNSQTETIGIVPTRNRLNSLPSYISFDVVPKKN